MLCLCQYRPALLRFWFQTDFRRKNSASVFKIQAGKTFSYHGYLLVTLHVQFLCSDWLKFDRWVHAQNLCSIFNVVYFDSWSWHSFESTCDVFNCLFPLDLQNEIQECSLIHDWFVYWVFRWEIRRLSKPIIRCRMASFLFFTLLDACENYKGSSDPCLTWQLSGAASRMVLYLMFVFCIEFNEVERGLCGYLVYPRL